jgi:hypothetical protein
MIMKTLLVSLALLGLLPAAVSQVPKDEASVRRAIDLQTAELWEREDFAQLEKVSVDYRNNKTRTPSGLWRLTVFYGSLQEQVSSDIDDPAWWEFMQNRAMKWTTRFPSSASAHLQYAQAILQRGWRVRGAGFSREVTPQGSKLFQERVAEARRYLEKHKTIAVQDPRWYELMINVATWQGWKEPEAKSLIEEAISREPEFWQTYFSAAEYYSPYWRGDAQELERFTNWAANRMGGADGDALYTRIYWWAAGRYFKGQFFESKINCARMMRGVDRLVQTNPDPWNINHFASFAVSCGDKKRARALFTRIGDNPDLEAWGRSSKTFARFKAWAME